MSDHDSESAPPDFRFLEFGLAPLQSFDPASLLSGDDSVDGFVLSLALAYNDLKGIQWMHYVLDKHQPPDLMAIDAGTGQWHGMRVQAARWLMALAHEIIHAIARADELGVLRKPMLRAVIKKLPNRHQRLWKELLAVSTKPTGAGASLRPYLRDLRNEGVFHFAYTERLLKAYRAAFLTDARTKHNERAYLSVGPTMKQTRFYFADAAAQRMYTGDETLQQRFTETEDFLEELHHTLAGFVWGYIRTRT